MKKEELKKSALRRMKIIQGQINSINTMIEDDAYCPDTMVQILAVQNALKQVEAKLLEGHLRTCVKKQMTQNKTDQAVEELLTVFQLAKKNK